MSSAPPRAWLRQPSWSRLRQWDPVQYGTHRRLYRRPGVTLQMPIHLQRPICILSLESKPQSSWDSWSKLIAFSANLRIGSSLQPSHQYYCSPTPSMSHSTPTSVYGAQADVFGGLNLPHETSSHVLYMIQKCDRG